MLGFALTLILLQSPQTVAVVLDTGTRIMTVTEAEQLDQTTRDPKVKAALVIALGTIPQVRLDEQMLDERPARREQLRWMRAPVQNPRRGQ